MLKFNNMRNTLQDMLSRYFFGGSFNQSMRNLSLPCVVPFALIVVSSSFNQWFDSVTLHSGLQSLTLIVSTMCILSRHVFLYFSKEFNFFGFDSGVWFGLLVKGSVSVQGCLYGRWRRD